ncbi:excisionase family DNA binding protein [Blastococcus saxobsidens]|uniref:Excisionase family DNA binding protein n=2 Tax=Blastococcus saxobsidens TaxID=138336 RepID=A0A4Q7Y6K8_9ACTN|nr:excisionase family DNA binding protein [Blastococcus saxobsidens]
MTLPHRSAVATLARPVAPSRYPAPRPAVHGAPAGARPLPTGARPPHPGMVARPGTVQHPGAVQRPAGERPAPRPVSFLTVAEVAAIMRVSKMTVYRLVHGGELSAVRVGRSFRVPEPAVRAYLSSARTDVA